jgi:hypothetical protein
MRSVGVCANSENKTRLSYSHQIVIVSKTWLVFWQTSLHAHIEKIVNPLSISKKRTKAHLLA